MSLQNTEYGKDKVSELLKDAQNIYFLGIGGISMSALAKMTVAQGFCAGGYDRVESNITKKLEDLNIPVYYELDPSRVEKYDALVYTVAISEDNPEYLKAKEIGIPVISRADYLGYIMSSYKKRIGISGMHGKSTTTAMVASVFDAGDADPTVLSGAELKGIESSYKAGGIDNFIFEACEYKDSFLKFYPSVAVVLNIDLDHLDYFSGLDHIKRSFSNFISKCGKDGVAVLNFDDANVRDVAKDYSGKKVTFGIEADDVDFRAVNIKHENRRSCFDIICPDMRVCHIELGVMGEHYVMDALAAAATGFTCGITDDGVKKGLLTFNGIRRRMDYRGKFEDADVYDDYAHHPTEIRSTLKSAEKLGYDKIWCVYQPHTYSRTAALYDDFVSAFNDVESNMIFTDIYAARETNEWGITSEKLASDVEGSKYFSAYDEIIGYLKQNVSKNDAIIIMGAGDIYCIFYQMGV